MATDTDIYVKKLTQTAMADAVFNNPLRPEQLPDDKKTRKPPHDWCSSRPGKAVPGAREKILPQDKASKETRMQLQDCQLK